MSPALVSDQRESHTMPLNNRGELCRFVASPFSGCHCYGITSAKIPLALYFCGGHYRECSIFQQHAEQNDASMEQPA